MYNPCRRRGIIGSGASARQVSVDCHQGDGRDFLRRHRLEAAAAARGDGKTRRAFLAQLLPRTADSRNLRVAWDTLAAGDGQAPGLDGFRLTDLEGDEVWQLIHTLRTAILTDTYRTAPDRQKQIPKASGTGYRTLSIPTVIDRFVQRASVQTVQPYLEPIQDDHSFGFRAHVDSNRALARAEELAVQEDRWVWLTEDLRDAFNHVPQRRLLDVVRVYLPEPKMLVLLERIVLTASGRGLRQGGNLSPLLLNLYLHHFLDAPWRKHHADVPLLRWADDVLVLCRDREEARQVYHGLRALLLPAGMQLKGGWDQALHDLGRGASAEWLGYRFSRSGTGLNVSTTEKAWKHLSEKLELAHEKDDSPIRAVQTILGWVGQMGPCFSSTDLNEACAVRI
jgi:RNA-directed DNA polymerase